MSKKQVWLTPEQVDLAVSALQFLGERLTYSHGSADPAYRVAANFTQSRISELITLFKGEPQS